MKNCAAAALLALLAASSAALGQMVVPPTSKPAPTPEFVPPPPPPPEGLTITPGGKPAQVVAPKAEIPPDLKWESLVKRDAEGALIPLDRPEWYAALDVNPLITDAERPRLAALIEERRPYFEAIVIDNLDLLMQIEAGGEGLTSHSMLSNVGRALAGDRTKSFSNELRNRGLLNPQQFAVHERIIKEYQTAEAGPPPTREGGAGRGAVVGMERSMLRQSSAEARYAWERMLVEAAGRLDAVNAKAAAFAGPAGDDLKKKLGAAKSGADTLALMKAAAMALDLDKHRALLNAVIETRESR